MSTTPLPLLQIQGGEHSSAQASSRGAPQSRSGACQLQQRGSEPHRPRDAAEGVRRGSEEGGGAKVSRG